MERSKQRGDARRSSRRYCLDIARKKFGPRAHFLKGAAGTPGGEFAVTIKPARIADKAPRPHIILARGSSWLEAIAAVEALTHEERNRIVSDALSEQMTTAVGPEAVQALQETIDAEAKALAEQQEAGQ